MLKKSLIALGMTLCCFVSGCAKITREYTPPEVISVKNSRVFVGEYDKVWKATVDSMAKSFWTLSNIEKDSGILSFFFITDDPSKGIDCGTVKVELEQFGKYAGTIIRNPANPNYEYSTHGGKEYNIVRESNELRCDCNVVVNRASENETMVSVNILYNLELGKKNTVVYSKSLGRKELVTVPVKMSFTGGAQGSSGGLTCVSTNDLEKAILNTIESTLKGR